MSNRRAPTRALETLLIAAAVTVSPVPTASAQTAASATFSQVWTSWNETDIVRDEGLAPTGTALVEQSVYGGKLGLFYSLDAGDYPSPGDWSFFEHNAGTVYRHELATATRFYVSGSAWWRANGDSWQMADYRGLTAAANLEHRLRPTATLRGGYRLDLRWFPELTAMDQVEHSGFVSAIANLPSRTTVIGETSLGGKSYGGGVSTFLPGSAAPGFDSSSHSGGATHGASSAGRGRGLLLGSAAAVPLSLENPGILAGQLTLFGRIAQSLTDQTGVHVEASRRFTFGDRAPAVIATPELLFDDGVYDDPYASDAVTWRAGIKHVSSGGLTLEGGLNRFVKDYTATLALGPEGAPAAGLALRSDDIWQVDASCTLPLWPDRTGKAALAAVISYRFVDHSSNDAYYNYRSQGLGVGLSVEY